MKQRNEATEETMDNFSTNNAKMKIYQIKKLHISFFNSYLLKVISKDNNFLHISISRFNYFNEILEYKS